LNLLLRKKLFRTSTTSPFLKIAINLKRHFGDRAQSPGSMIGAQKWHLRDPEKRVAGFGIQKAKQVYKIWGYKKTYLLKLQYNLLYYKLLNV